MVKVDSNMQTIYINIDDSGKLVDTERVSIYAGLVFISKNEKDKFITQYRSIVESIKCKYCQKDISICNSNKSCPELKHNMLKPKHNRQLMNYIKKYSILCCIINFIGRLGFILFSFIKPFTVCLINNFKE